MILRLQGGLGNQIFQLLALRYLRQLHPREKSVIFTDHLSQFRSPRAISITSFIRDEDITGDIGWGDKLLFETKASRVLSRFSIHAIQSVKQLQTWKGQCLNGYFQDIYNYPELHTIKEKIRELDSIVKKHIPAEPPISMNDCAIHLRLTDFAETEKQIHFLHSYRVPYIKRSMMWLRNNTAVNRFVLFSDSPAEAKDLINEDGVVVYQDFAPGEVTLFQEFCQFCSFSNMIASNSTFSFWGSMLGNRKQVVFPVIWDKFKPNDDRTFQQNLLNYNKFSDHQHSMQRL